MWNFGGCSPIQLNRLGHFTCMLAIFLFALSRSVFEAEDAKLTDVTIETSEAGYSGTGYVEMHDSGSILWTVDIAQAGFYNLIICFNTKYGAKNQNLAVNGESVGEVSFAEVSSWTTSVVAKKLNLKAGANTVEITPSWGWMLFDYIDFEAYEDTPFSLSDAPVTKNPTSAATALYTYLVSKFQKATISGTMTLQGDTSRSFRENNWVHDTTGKYPSIVGLDFMFQVGKNTEWYTGNEELRKSVVNDAVAYWKRGGIPALCWHWRDPSGATEAFYSPSSGNDATDFDASKAVDKSTQEYQYIIRDIDVIATELLDLQSQGTAALWRPLHEASGGWFWWGYKGAAACKALWAIIYDRLVNYHKITNLIWVWTTGTDATALDWYPGDDTVDIVGMDIYPDTGDHNAQSVAFESAKDVFKASKIIALSECGSIPDADEMVAAGATWSYFMPWYGDYTIPNGNPAHNSEDFWKSQMGNSFVISLDQMPGW